MYLLFFEPGKFNSFGTVHLAIILGTLVLTVWFPLIARRRLGPQQQLWVMRALSIITCVGILIGIIFRVSAGSFDWRENLPLNMCNLFALFMPVLFWRCPSKRFVEVFYFLIVGGTGQALLTPDLSHGFPHLLFLSYWMVHSGLILHIVYVVVVWRMIPRQRGVIYSLLWFNAYALIILIFNYFAGANYLYLLEKPAAASLLNYLGPWPWYIFTAQPLALVILWLSWLPFIRSRSD